MEYLDSFRVPIREGFYKDGEDESCVLYLFKEREKWRFQTPDSSGEYDFPSDFFKDLVTIDDPVKEIEYFRRLNKNNLADFIEKKIEEDYHLRKNH